jgi:hypothetical protein
MNIICTRFDSDEFRNQIVVGRVNYNVLLFKVEMTGKVADVTSLAGRSHASQNTRLLRFIAPWRLKREFGEWQRSGVEHLSSLVVTVKNPSLSQLGLTSIATLHPISADGCFHVSCWGMNAKGGVAPDFQVVPLHDVNLKTTLFLAVCPA